MHGLQLNSQVGAIIGFTLVIGLAPVTAQLPPDQVEIDRVSVRSSQTSDDQAQVVEPAEMFEVRVFTNGINEVTAANLVIDGEEWVADGGGGACRSDGQAFLGWSRTQNGAQLRVICRVPRSAPPGAEIEVIGFQFAGCQSEIGPTGADEGERCQVRTADQRFVVEGDPDDDEEPRRLDRATEVEESIIERVLEIMFGNLDGDDSDDRGDRDTRRGTNDFDGSDGEGGSSSSRAQEVSRSAREFAACYAENVDFAVANRYLTHLPGIYDECLDAGCLDTQLAYMIATVRHETGDFRWMAEIGTPSYFNYLEGRTDLCNYIERDGFNYRGSCYVQLTGRCNFAKFTAPVYRNQDPALSNSAVQARYSRLRPGYQFLAPDEYDYVLNPDQLRNEDQPGPCAAILVDGIMNGTFTGGALPTYVSNTQTDFHQARRTVNGMDQSGKIAGYAQTALEIIRSCNTSSI